jgi:hypothetical protein
MASTAKKENSTNEPEVMFVPKGRASARGAKVASPSVVKEKWACPISGCRESAIHPLDSCKGFGDLSVTKRRKMLKERNLCECCLMDCRDKETGASCYRQNGFRRHHLSRAAGANRASKDAPPKKFRRLNGGEQKHGKNQRTRTPKRVATWCFSAFDSNDKLVWLRATKNRHVWATRITHQAMMRLGLSQSVTEAYQVRLRLSDQPQFILGAETLECVRPRDERDSSRALQPDMIIGWVDWDKVEPFIHSGWMIPGQVPLGATAPATKWHLRVNLRCSPPVYLNAQLDPMRRRTTITHEAAVRVGQTFHSFYLLFVRTEAGEVGSLAADGADAIVRADKQRPADPAERGPDILLDAAERCSPHVEVPQSLLEE